MVTAALEALYDRQLLGNQKKKRKEKRFLRENKQQHISL
jgi:hypothetical protein